MKVFVNKIIVLLSISLLSVSVSASSNDLPDIRFRTIIYFYPGIESADISRVEKEFKNFKVVDKLPKSSVEPVVSLSVVKDVKTIFPVPDLAYLSYFGRGLDKQQANRIQESNLSIVIDVAYPMNMSFEGLKAVTTSIFNYADSANALIWDSETRELFTPDAWKDTKINSWTEEVPIIEDHTVIHAYKNKGGVRAITLGMAKFGLPDIVVNDFSWSLNQQMGSLINLVAQSMAEGLIPDKEGILKVKIESLKNTGYKKKLMASLKDNAQLQVQMLIGKGQWEEGDPDNYIMELLFHNLNGASLSEKHEKLLSSLFGWEDKISYVQHNQQIEAASQRARKQLNRLRKEFNMGLNPGEFIQLKAPFQTPEGGNEWMWVEVLSWNGTEIKGLLKNEPYHIPTLKGGSEVVINQENVFDYIKYNSDGTSEGNKTGALIQKYQK